MDSNEQNNNKIFTAIESNDAGALKLLLNKDNVNIFDENSMTPLQHASYKGNKEIVQMLLDQGADVNACQHEHGYTSLHFAGLSGNADVCRLLLLAGAKSHLQNTVGRTAAQMAGFVGNHNCVTTINNFIPKKEIDFYTTVQGLQSSASLPLIIADSFHKFVMEINVNPVHVALTLSRTLGLLDHLAEVHATLELMRNKEMKRGPESNEVMAFKYHYFSYIVKEIEKNNGKSDVLETFIRKLLKTGKDGNSDYMEAFLRECVREFPYRECTIFRQMVTSLASKGGPSALCVITSAINGQRGFVDNISICSTCGQEKPTKKCSKCKAVQYCDRECQRLHWFMHKKCCARLSQGNPSTNADVDVQEVSSHIQDLLVNN